MAEHDLAKAISTMGAALHVLQSDLNCESVRVQLEQKLAQNRVGFVFCCNHVTRAQNSALLTPQVSLELPVV